MLPAGFNYALFRLQRPDWVPEAEFVDAMNILRAARVIMDLGPMDDLKREQEEILLLRVSTSGTMECWLRFRWDEPYAHDLTVLVQGQT
jgi:hypothetical protein